MIAINGLTSTIATAFLKVLGAEPFVAWRDLAKPPPPAERFLIAQGYLKGRSAGDHDAETGPATFQTNFLAVAAACDNIFVDNPTARVVVIGSESGFSGSYDTAYAGAKAALHLYVETKKLKPDQQLICVAPGIIGDSGMTHRREDLDRLAGREQAHPKRRFLRAVEVARLVHYLLYEDEGYLSGAVIRMNGGPA